MTETAQVNALFVRSVTNEDRVLYKLPEECVHLVFLSESEDASPVAAYERLKDLDEALRQENFIPIHVFPAVVV